MLHHLNLETLIDRRRTANLNFLVKLLSGQTESSSLLFTIFFKIPVRSTHQYVSFDLPSFSINYDLNDPLRRCMSIANSDRSFIFSWFC